jgi:hypothetical protein
MGRFFSIDRSERICDLCNKEELGDEFNAWTYIQIMKHIYVCWKAIYKYKTYLCNSNCKAILTLASITWIQTWQKMYSWVFI